MADASITTDIITYWIKQGDKGKRKKFHKFICYWIAFNAYFVSETTEMEGEAFKKMKDSTSDIHNKLTKDFSTVLKDYKGRLEDLKAVCPIADDSPKAKRPMSLDHFTFPEVLDVLYRIRCNLMHGNKNGSVKRDKEVIKAATPVLEVLVKEFTKKGISG